MPGLGLKWFAFLQRWPGRAPPILIPRIERAPRLAIQDISSVIKGRIDVLNVKCAMTLLHEPNCNIDGIELKQPHAPIIVLEPVCVIAEI